MEAILKFRKKKLFFSFRILVLVQEKHYKNKNKITKQGCSGREKLDVIRSKINYLCIKIMTNIRINTEE